MCIFEYKLIFYHLNVYKVCLRLTNVFKVLCHFQFVFTLRKRFFLISLRRVFVLFKSDIKVYRVTYNRVLLNEYKLVNHEITSVFKLIKKK
jgi:hypothetical protein